MLVLPQAASAKEGSNAFRVVAPAGKVGWVRGHAAEAWWHDYDTPGKRGCRCISAGAAVRYSRGLFRRFSSPTAEWPAGFTPWLLPARTHWGAMLYYPPSAPAPGVVMTPAARGPRGWQFHWEIASPRMQNILQLAVERGTITTYRTSSALPLRWAIGGGTGAVLIAAFILGARRHPRVLGA